MIELAPQQRWIARMRPPGSTQNCPLLEVVILEVTPSKQFIIAYAATGPNMNVPNVLTVSNWEFIELLETTSNDAQGNSPAQS